MAEVAQDSSGAGRSAQVCEMWCHAMPSCKVATWQLGCEAGAANHMTWIQKEEEVPIDASTTQGTRGRP